MKKNYLAAVLAALATWFVLNLTTNGLMQCIPYAALFGYILFRLDNIKPRAFWPITWHVYACFIGCQLLSAAIITTTIRRWSLDAILKWTLFNVVLAGVLTAVMAVFVLKSLKNNR